MESRLILNLISSKISLRYTNYHISIKDAYRLIGIKLEGIYPILLLSELIIWIKKWIWII